MDRKILLEKDIYNNIKIKELINNILKNIEVNKNILQEAIKRDTENGNAIELNKIKDIVKKYTNYKEILTAEDIKSQKVDGIGNIAVVYSGTPDIMVDMAIKAIITNNNIVFFPNLVWATTECMTTIFNESMKSIKYKVCIANEEIEELYKNQELFDVAVFIGDKYEYYKFKQKFKKDIIYNSYGSIQIYSDNDYFENILKQIDEYVYNNNLVSFYYENENIEEAIKKINEIAITDTVAIFTKNSKKAIELIKNVKANKIFVNKYPFENYEFEFDEKKLLIKKQIITE